MDMFAKNLQFNPQHYQYCATRTAARSSGAKFILHGTLGELTTSYYGHEQLVNLFCSGQWITLCREILAHKKIYSRSFHRIFAGNVLLPLLPRSWQTRLKPQNNSLKILNNSLIKRDFIDSQIGAAQLTQIIHASSKLGNNQSINPRKNSLATVQWFLQHCGTTFSDLSTTSETAVYASNPYFDKRLIEFCLNVPNEYRFRKGYTRGIIRFGTKDLMPEKIRWRTSKEPFLPDYPDRYNKQLSQARAIVNELSQNPLVQEVIDVKQLQELLVHSSTSNRLCTQADFINFLVIPRMIYLAKFLSSF